MADSGAAARRSREVLGLRGVGAGKCLTDGILAEDVARGTVLSVVVVVSSSGRRLVLKADKGDVGR